MDTLYHHAMDHYSQEPGAEVDKKKGTSEGITKMVQTQVLGHPNRVPPHVHTQYEMPLAKGKDKKWQVVKQSMTGSMANQMLDGLPILIKFIFSPDNDESGDPLEICGKNSAKEQAWYEVCEVFVECMNIMEQHDNLEEMTILDLEDKCNAFIHQWIELAGPGKVTNYIHMLGAMHFTYFI